jgi:hypothetical protein
MTIYLCVKTHAITGLKYLCKTTKDPFTYKGSGKNWIPHLKKYGNEHYTEIIKICQTQEEFYYWGKFYSNLWNIVNSQDDFGNKIWANIIPETGGGGNQIITEKTKNKITLTNSLPEIKMKRSEAMKKVNQNPETKLKRRLANIKKFQDPAMRKAVSKFGEDNSSYDKTVYTFEHTSGIIEICTGCQLRKKYTELSKGGLYKIKRNPKRTHKGWSVRT